MHPYELRVEDATLALGFQHCPFGRGDGQHHPNSLRSLDYVGVSDNVAAGIDHDARANCLLPRNQGCIRPTTVFNRTVTGYQDLHHSLGCLSCQAFQCCIEGRQGLGRGCSGLDDPVLGAG